MVDALAVYRVVRLLQEDTILDRPRGWVERRIEGHKSAELLTCPWCLSVWVAGGVVAFRRVAPRQWSPIAEALAFSAVAGVISAEL